ncbi:MAG: hypothetical protein JWQ21_634 [Herminiimonas sp.]|nr:hypothetical protein [Herminiimonas sp.]
MAQHIQDFNPANELVREATQLIIRRNAVSASLLQRHFRLGYQAAVILIRALETEGIISAQSANGTRQLTVHALGLRQAILAPSRRELFEGWAIDPLEGGDGGDPGTPETPSLWLFGIEHGDATNIEQEPAVSKELRDYSIDKQLTYQFNQKAFKLLAAIHGEPVERSEEFARRHQPWVPGNKGYFKGNLFPYPAQKVALWSGGAAEETGFEGKDDYVRWCNENRIPAIARAVEQYRPRLFIGVGNSFAREFSRAYFGAEVPLRQYQFTENGRLRRIYYATYNGGRFVVIPHLNYYANCLNSDLSIQTAGRFIAGLMN